MNAFLRKLWPFQTWQRTTVCVLLGMALLTVACWFWAAWAERLIQIEVHAAHERGEFILLDDYQQPDPIPDDQNAAVFWQRAADAAVFTAEQDELERSSNLDGLGQYPLTPDEAKFLATVLDDRDEVWSNVRAARGAFRLQWKVDPRTYLHGEKLNELNAMRAVATMLSYRSMLAHLDQDDDVVIDDARSVLKLSRDIESLPPSIVTHLVAVGCSAVGASIIERSIPDLQIAGDAKQKPGDASAQDVATLIRELLDESSLLAGFKRAMQGERAFALHYGRKLTVKPIHGITQKVALARVLKWERSLDAAATQPSYPDAKKIFAANPPPPDHVYGCVPALVNIVIPSFTRVLETEFRIRTDRRLTALALAIRWYQCEHDGRFPERLEQLVPNYIASVPLDPLAGDGRTLAYRRDGDQAMTYSVGMDAIDDGGSVESILRNQPRFRGLGHDRWSEKDAVMYLVRIPREMPATESSEP